MNHLVGGTRHRLLAKRILKYRGGLSYLSDSQQMQHLLECLQASRPYVAWAASLVAARYGEPFLRDVVRSIQGYLPTSIWNLEEECPAPQLMDTIVENPYFKTLLAITSSISALVATWKEKIENDPEAVQLSGTGSVCGVDACGRHTSIRNYGGSCWVASPLMALTSNIDMMFAICDAWKNEPIANLFRLAGTSMYSLSPEGESRISGRLDNLINDHLPFVRTEGGTCANIDTIINYLVTPKPNWTLFMIMTTIENGDDAQSAIVIVKGHAMALVRCQGEWQIRDPNNGKPYTQGKDFDVNENGFVTLKEELKQKYGNVQKMRWLVRIEPPPEPPLSSIYGSFSLLCLNEVMQGKKVEPDDFVLKVYAFGGAFYTLYVLSALSLYQLAMHQPDKNKKDFLDVCQKARRSCGNLIEDIMHAKLLREDVNAALGSVEAQRQFDTSDTKTRFRWVLQGERRDRRHFVHVSESDLKVSSATGFLTLLLHVIQTRYLGLNETGSVPTDRPPSLNLFQDFDFYAFWDAFYTQVLQTLPAPIPASIPVKETDRMFCDGIEGAFFDKMLLRLCKKIQKEDVVEKDGSVYLRTKDGRIKIHFPNEMLLDDWEYYEFKNSLSIG